MKFDTFHVTFVSSFLTQETPSGIIKIADVAPATQHSCFTLGFKENKTFTSSSTPRISWWGGKLSREK